MNYETKAVSLFSGGAIGDLGFRAAGYSFISMCEIEQDRAQLAQLNFPEAKVFVGDISKFVTQITPYAKKECSKNGSEIFLVLCTAPCQGMSKSGQGTLLRRIREGKRPKLDPRNRLILPALDIIKEIQPRFVVFENVCEMRNTIIKDTDGVIRPILDIIRDSLDDRYNGTAYDVEFADYGIPERRKRLITIYTLDQNTLKFLKNGISLIPMPTHSREPSNGKKPWISLREALQGFPSIDAKSKETATDPRIHFHRVPVMDPRKYEWIKHTPPSASAFDNQCINPKCLFQGNRTHGARRNHEGINQPRKDTPLYCERCGQLLPRPHTIKRDGTLRIMSGYTSAYKRMDPDLPAPALTRNLSFACSDNKIHPFENRVLSLAEAFKIHTITDYKYRLGPIRTRKGLLRSLAPDTLIREVLGESIPPRFTELLGHHLIMLSKGQESSAKLSRQLQLSML